ncbi:histidine kinase [Chitinophaga solisilvae]|uniref:histidine kinase n=1 Tax=Chitinophaga solisilvae TaxID=1233460 RepID=UPI00136B8FA6|nr:histidine kinase [Chitinophaga solisilvae]
MDIPEAWMYNQGIGRYEKKIRIQAAILLAHSLSSLLLIMKYKEPYRYLIHLGICMALVLLYALPQLRNGWRYPSFLPHVIIPQILYGFINFQLFYLLAFGLFPRPVQSRLHMRVALYAVAAIVFFSLLKYLIGDLFFRDIILIKTFSLINQQPNYYTFGEYFRKAMKTGLGVTLLAYAYRLFLQWRNSDQQDQQLTDSVARAHIRFERMHQGSALLLQQLQALTPVLANEATRSEEGVKAILLLSDLLRYMLYDKAVEQEKVSLKKELYYFQQYLTLRSYLHPLQKLEMRITGEEQDMLVTPLQLQDAMEKYLQQLPAVAGTIIIAVQVTSHTVSLSAAPAPAAAVSHLLSAKLYPYYA